MARITFGNANSATKGCNRIPVAVRHTELGGLTGRRSTHAKRWKEFLMPKANLGHVHLARRAMHNKAVCSFITVKKSSKHELASYRRQYGRTAGHNLFYCTMCGVTGNTLKRIEGAECLVNGKLSKRCRVYRASWRERVIKKLKKMSRKGSSVEKESMKGWHDILTGLHEKMKCVKTEDGCESDGAESCCNASRGIACNPL